nr:zinc finger matrin-type protein 5-like [Procambarus clarkii]
MGKRYYCDYCDRSLPYSVEARKKHDYGHHHQKLKNHHYNKFKSARERLQDELSREKCRRFHSGQDCSFGDTCIYSHLTQIDISNLKQQAMEEEAAVKRSKLPSLVKSGNEPSLESWLSEREQVQSASNYPMESISKWELKYVIPQALQAMFCLPPSLIPPSAESLLDCDFVDWG